MPSHMSAKPTWSIHDSIWRNNFSTNTKHSLKFDTAIRLGEARSGTLEFVKAS